MVTYMISQVEESFLLRRAAGSFITLYPSFMTFLWQVFYNRWQLPCFAVSKMNFKKSCVLCRNFISTYKINRTLHGRLGIRILSSRAESISHSFALLTRERYFQHSKIKFVSPRSHVMSSLLTSYWSQGIVVI